MGRWIAQRALAPVLVFSSLARWPRPASILHLLRASYVDDRSWHLQAHRECNRTVPKSEVSRRFLGIWF
jgi:hypothetical protein